jgi:hypothetical protein
MAIEKLAHIAENGKSETAQIAASVALLDRAWGRPAQTLHATHTPRDFAEMTEAELMQIIRSEEDAAPATQSGGRENRPFEKARWALSSSLGCSFQKACTITKRRSSRALLARHAERVDTAAAKRLRFWRDRARPGVRHGRGSVGIPSASERCYGAL